MERLYDARGNRYLVVSPETAARAGVAIPKLPEAAAAEAVNWVSHAIAAFCRLSAPVAGAKPFRSDGLLIGPFEAAAPFSLLIVNTDGSLAERSGNGLTIFATALRDLGLAPAAFDLLVHHGRAAPTRTGVEFGEVTGIDGVWLSLGEPGFGADAVAARAGASRPTRLNGVTCSHVPALAALDERWSMSQFVGLGNPHCVTFLAEAGILPGWEDLNADPLLPALRRIADPLDNQGLAGIVCPAGLNLQWAAPLGANRFAARVFERGEGPTRSSGTSAVAVAAAALRLGLAEAGGLDIVMLGGIMPVIGEYEAGRLHMRLFGTAAIVTSA